MADTPRTTRSDSTAAAKLATLGDVARRLGVPVHRVTYILRTRNIQPTSRAATYRLFDNDVVARIAKELRGGKGVARG
jgi:DNA-binding transcriptional MerR regulator